MKWLSILLTIPIALHAAGNPLPKITDIKVNERLAALGQRPLENPVAYAAAFSPDGARLAVAIIDDPNLIAPPTVPNLYLLVIETADPFKTVAGLNLTSFQPKPSRSWSGLLDGIALAPDGKSVLADNKWVQIPGGDHCSVNGVAAKFIAADKVVVKELDPSASAPRLPGPNTAPTKFNLLGAGCKLENSWTDKPATSIAASSSDLGMLALSHINQTPGRATKDPEDLSVLSTRTPSAPFSVLQTMRLATFSQGFIFANDLLCRLTASMAGNSHIECIDPRTGKSVRHGAADWQRSSRLNSAGGGRIAIGDSQQPPPQSRPRGIWDVQTGKIVAKWTLPPEPMPSVGPLTLMPRALALSPDGHTLADAGDGALALYRVP